MVGTANSTDPSEPIGLVVIEALADVVRAVDRLRDAAVTNFDKDNPHLLEIEDFWWQTRRFSDQLFEQLKAVS